VIFAIDCDGTLWKEDFPSIGSIFPEAISAVKEIKKLNHTIIIWTCRQGKLLEEALATLKYYGVPYDYVNENVPAQVELYGNDCRKVGAHVFVDDRNVGKWSWDDVLEIARRNRV
jgi:membrane-anchored protein YejM (alkaline phosphatase superfamily)